MLTGSLHIRFLSIDYDSGSFEVTIRCRELTACTSFYANRLAWQEFGQHLQQWPLLPQVAFQEEHSSGELRLTAFHYDDNCHTALRVLLNNADVRPGPYRLEFALPVDAAGLATLGGQLAQWPQQDEDELFWEAYVS
jgi:hypothetical protein